MPLRLYNTLTRRKEDFRPLDPEGRRVSFYNCGPTVYGPFHIGNARNFIVVDTIRRWLAHRGYEVRFVQNITDVDDKILNRAREEGISSHEVAEKYTKLFFEHLTLLGVRRADEHPRATEFIPGMLDLVQKLIDGGHAYTSEDGSVWFDVRSFAEYGKLSRKNLDDMREGERVSADQQALKRNPLDFALWKASKPGEDLAWETPWGTGRPGWHLECSCMAMACHQSATIDIHSGGVDLQFPHHENEIAQSEAATGKPFATYWLHNGFLNIDGEKMSKSLGNFRTIDALLEKFDGLTLRHFLLSAHYRSGLDFTADNLEAATKASQRYATAEREARAALGTGAPAAAEDAELAALRAKFGEAMDDDFNTAQAIGVMFELVTVMNSRRAALSADTRGALASAVALLAEFRELLGLTSDLEREDTGLGGNEEQLLQLLIDVRNAARAGKQFALADTIRNRLTDMGIALEDKPGGVTTWKRA
jgi:cysteinyl-tRNA synthetase